MLDVGGDDVALAEVFDVENLPQDALGEEVLDEHFLDGGLGEIRVQRAAANGDEAGKRGVVFRVLLARFFQDRGERFAQGGDDVLEVRDGGFPLRDGLGSEFEELLEDPGASAAGRDAARFNAGDEVPMLPLVLTQRPPRWTRRRFCTRGSIRLSKSLQ